MERLICEVATRIGNASEETTLTLAGMGPNRFVLDLTRDAAPRESGDKQKRRADL